MKVYIDKNLWRRTDEDLDPEDDVEEAIIDKVDKLLTSTNKHLRKLDEGGFGVKFGNIIHRLENSDVKMRNFYVDRINKNIEKKFNAKDVFGYTFTFQEAVQEMPNILRF